MREKILTVLNRLLLLQLILGESIKVKNTKRKRPAFLTFKSKLHKNRFAVDCYTTAVVQQSTANP